MNESIIRGAMSRLEAYGVRESSLLGEAIVYHGTDSMSKAYVLWLEEALTDKELLTALENLIHEARLNA